MFEWIVWIKGLCFNIDGMIYWLMIWRDDDIIVFFVFWFDWFFVFFIEGVVYYVFILGVCIKELWVEFCRLWSERVYVCEDYKVV